MNKKLIEGKETFFELMKGTNREPLSLNDVSEIIKESHGAIADAIVFAFAAGYGIGYKKGLQDK